MAFHEKRMKQRLLEASFNIYFNTKFRKIFIEYKIDELVCELFEGDSIELTNQRTAFDLADYNILIPYTLYN